MNPSQPLPSIRSVTSCDCQSPCAPLSTLCWGAILAGTSAALALQVLFMLLGGGLGLAIYSPITDENPVAHLSIGALLIQSLCAILSLWFGGWVAGRFTSVGSRITGWLHGFSVWCAATVGGVLLVILGVGVMLGGLSAVVGGGLSAAGKPVAAVAGGAVDVVGDAMKQSGDTLTSFVEEALSNPVAEGAAGKSVRAKREIGLALARLFNPSQEGGSVVNRSAAVKALMNHTGMSQADANRVVTEWTVTYEQLKADWAAAKEAAAIQAREAAASASSTLATFSLAAFFVFLLGALAATWGGRCGALCAMKCEQVTDRHGCATTREV